MPEYTSIKVSIETVQSLHHTAYGFSSSLHSKHVKYFGKVFTKPFSLPMALFLSFSGQYIQVYIIYNIYIIILKLTRHNIVRDVSLTSSIVLPFFNVLLIQVVVLIIISSFSINVLTILSAKFTQLHFNS